MDESKPFWEQSESRRLEFKEAWPKGDQIARTVVAFANGAGGKEALGTGRSEIRNRILAPIFKEMKLIEAWGTGIRKMQSETAKYPEIDLVLQEIGHAFQVQFKKKESFDMRKTRKEPLSPIQRTITAQVEQVQRTYETGLLERIVREFPDLTAQVTAQVLDFCRTPRKASEIMELLQLSHWKTFQTNYLNPLLEVGLIERTIPDKPRSSKQQYRLSKKRKELIEKLK